MKNNKKKSSLQQITKKKKLYKISIITLMFKTKMKKFQIEFSFSFILRRVRNSFLIYKGFFRYIYYK